MMPLPSPSYITKNGAPGSALAYTAWAIFSQDLPTPRHRAVSHHRTAAEAIQACPESPPILPIHSFCLPAHGPNLSKYAILDRHGSPLWAGARVRIRANDEGRVPFEDYGTIISINSWRQAQISLSRPRTTYAMMPGGVLAITGQSHSFNFIWDDIVRLGPKEDLVVCLRLGGTAMVLDSPTDDPYWVELVDDPRSARRIE